ncbi:NAD(P)H-hydrate dehydratase [Lysobacter enzymogenes]|uniref:Bifunctional NAD(P)H-hydrate repair enzyme n=1 Tax=Lysobacter enzymogenes TaxID=69 RepID=A0A3N2RHA5_LYSEN|nr:NAD(P)H-hydrate dehydratase [Lysobacter enzymogenes]ROU06769.1 NAD(P)H-hydrate dehydratase [Lysobacter enzymogenes]
MSRSSEIAGTAAGTAETPLYDAAALRAVERAAADALGDAFELMRRAGEAAWREWLDRWTQAYSLLVVCGPGNNGGDGYVMATHALRNGRRATVVRLREHAPRGELARRAAAEYAEAGGAVAEFDGALPAADAIVDALFGIGLSRAPDAAASALIEAINAHGAPVFALDAPSGVDADRGAALGTAVAADCTIEFIARKHGLRTGAALDCIGEFALADLGLRVPQYGAYPVAEWLREPDLKRWLRPRRRDSHKGRNGRVLCIGGDHGHGGALVLCAQAALRSGAGLVDAATRADHVAPLLARLPEAMPRAVESSDDARAALDAADVIAIGPGLGTQEWGAHLFVAALASAKPLLLDADALNLLVAQPRALPADCILTPHPGEAARLLGCDTARVQADRYAAVRALTERYRCAVVLKGAGTLVHAPGQGVRAIGAGNPGMAVGGMGDVLSGAIAALRAQGLDAFDAASCGALLHSVAGDLAAREDGERGLLPSDLMPWLRRCANPRADER